MELPDAPNGSQMLPDGSQMLSMGSLNRDRVGDIEPLQSIGAPRCSEWPIWPYWPSGIPGAQMGSAPPLKRIPNGAIPDIWESF